MKTAKGQGCRRRSEKIIGSLSHRTLSLEEEQVTTMDVSFTIRGVIPPLLTPFTDNGDKLDEEALRAHVTWLIDKGVHGVMPCGTTGEGPLLAISERKRVVEVVVEAVAHRVPVLAHVGTLTTHETIDMACHAQGCGVEAISVVTPYYFRLPESALVEHFCRIADAVTDTPVFLYNIPQCTGNALSLPAVKAIITRCPNIVGIKDSSENRDTLLSLTGLNEGRFQVICGSDSLLSYALEAGACASVSGNSNVFPEVVVELFRAFWQGDLDGAHRQQERLNQVIESLQSGPTPSLFKRVLELRGLRGGAVRPPLPEATEEMFVKAQQKLRSYQLL
jgi:4-hydroxy-tetrahydrodipicolinate synthase